MLSLSSGGMSAAHAGKYFAQEDYYLKGGESSQWLGKAAKELGLEGKVDEQAFKNLASGKSPDGTEQLVSPKIIKGAGGGKLVQHRAGNDLTFSAPKSVSIAYAAGNHEVKEIWDQAVINVMQHIEKHYSAYRTPHGVEVSGNLVAAKFDHVTSRALDPEVHSHVFLLNVTKTPEGGWKANEPKNIYADKMTLGLLVRHEAIRLFRERQYGIDIKDPERLYFELRGVRQVEMETFSNGSAAIAAKVAEWKQEQKFPDVEDYLLKKMAALDTRDPKHKVAREEVHEVWQQRFMAVPTTAREILQRIEEGRQPIQPPFPEQQLEQGPERGPLSSDEVLQGAAERLTVEEAVFDRAELLKIAAQLSGGRHSLAELNEAIDGPAVGSEAALGPAQQKTERRFLEPADYPTTMDRVIDHTNLVTLKRKPGYKAAKERGDFEAAHNIVEALIKEKACAKIKALLPEGKPVYVVPVQQREDKRMNMLPIAYAEELADRIGAEVWSGIVKVSGNSNTGKSAAERMQNAQVFDGDFPPQGSTIVVVDDVFTSGGTVASLVDSLAKHGCTPVVTSVLAPSRYGLSLKPSQEQINGLLRKAGSTEREFTDRLGFSPRALTANEIKLYLRYGKRGIEGARHSFLAAGSKGSSGKHPPLQGSEKSGSQAKSPPEEVIKTVSKNGLCFIGQEKHGWKAGKKFYTTREMIELERRNLENLQNLKPFPSSTTEQEVRAYLAGLAAEPGDRSAAYRAGLLAAEKSGPVRLTPGQEQCVIEELAGGRAFSAVQGDPGTGKTFIAQIVEQFDAEVLQPSGRQHRTLYLAYTGKAALEMTEASGKESWTVDSFLNRYRSGNLPELPEGAQIVIKIDEASFVGGRQADQVLAAVQELQAQGRRVKLNLTGDSKQMQSLQASPFFAHAAQLAREGGGDYAELKEIVRQKDAGLLEVAKQLNLSTDNPGQNAQKAFDLLKEQGRVTELSDRGELTRAAVSHFLAESEKPSPDPVKSGAGAKQSVLLITPLNADRRELNNQVRDELIRAGKLDRGEQVEVLTPAEQTVTAAGYRTGMVVSFNQRERGRSRQGEVIETDPEKNTVRIRFSGKETGVFTTIELAEKTSLHRREMRQFSVGDRVVFGRNTRDRSVVAPDGSMAIGVRNGEMGGIEELSRPDGRAVALVRLSGGRLVRVELERYGPQHIDHGYAVTIYKGEGVTIDSVIPFNYVRPGTENCQNAFGAIIGMPVTGAEFNKWKRSLSEYEKAYRMETDVGEHRGEVGFTMIRDRFDESEHKGVAVRFHNGPAVAQDEKFRQAMREAGMHWIPEREVWVTSADNDRAAPLFANHPLRDPDYLSHLKTADFGNSEKNQPVPVQEERNYTTELDTTQERQRFGRASFNAFNVALTRARHEARVFTNSSAGLRQAIGSVDEKTSTIKFDDVPTIRLDRERPFRSVIDTSHAKPAPAQPPAGPQQQKVPAELAGLQESLQRLKRMPTTPQPTQSMGPSQPQPIQQPTPKLPVWELELKR